MPMDITEFDEDSKNPFGVEMGRYVQESPSFKSAKLENEENVWNASL